MLKRTRLEVDNYDKQDRGYTTNFCVDKIKGMKGKSKIRPAVRGLSIDEGKQW